MYVCAGVRVCLSDVYRRRDVSRDEIGKRKLRGEDSVKNLEDSVKKLPPPLGVRIMLRISERTLEAAKLVKDKLISEELHIALHKAGFHSCL